jgi:5'-deoxynucleotidase YfbR-like HD superfamily hydrolase
VTLRKIIDEDDMILRKVDLSRLDLMRNVARTRRCHTQMVIHHQSVGEHTFSALAILDLIAPECRKEVWRALLYHDAPEAITGDVPAPAKWKYPNLEEALKRAEQAILDDHYIHVELYEHESMLCKYADLMELVWYGLEEMRMGNGGVSPMVVAAFRAMNKRKLSDVNLRALHFYEYSVHTFTSLGGLTDGI